MNDLSEMKVMIVDDTAANIDVLRRILSEDGFEISIAMRG
jgi:CheY-like chemotaxis protein